MSRSTLSTAVTAPNRFYQVPHCTGMGRVRPNMLADMREVKAEGGWGVVCTEYNSIHPSSDDSPHPYASLWDDSDVRAHRLMTDKVHKYGALGYVGFAQEVQAQERDMGIEFDYLIVCVVTGSTQAGMIVGFKADGLIPMSDFMIKEVKRSIVTLTDLFDRGENYLFANFQSWNESVMIR